MPVLTDPRHDLAHPVESDPAWGESYFFYVYDPSHDVGVWGGVRLKQNQEISDDRLYVILPGGGTAKFEAEKSFPKGSPEVLMIDDIVVEMVEPMEEWRLSGRAEVVEFDRDEQPIGAIDVYVDLTYRAVTPPIGTDGQRRAQRTDITKSSGKMLGKGHFDQPGRFSGTIIVGDERYELDPGTAVGGRDKSWGARRWHSPDAWRWFAINIGQEAHFGGFYMRIAEGDLHRGWCWVDGEFTSVNSWTFQSEFEKDGFTPKRTDVVVEDKNGRRYSIVGEILSVFPLRPAEGTLLLTCLVKWTYHGRVGYGLTDYLYQMKEGKPIVFHQ